MKGNYRVEGPYEEPVVASSPPPQPSAPTPKPAPAQASSVVSVLPPISALVPPTVVYQKVVLVSLPPRGPTLGIYDGGSAGGAITRLYTVDYMNPHIAIDGVTIPNYRIKAMQNLALEIAQPSRGLGNVWDGIVKTGTSIVGNASKLFNSIVKIIQNLFR